MQVSLGQECAAPGQELPGLSAVILYVYWVEVLIRVMGGVDWRLSHGNYPSLVSFCKDRTSRGGFRWLPV